jgi:CrcB protein
MKGIGGGNKIIVKKKNYADGEFFFRISSLCVKEKNMHFALPVLLGDFLLVALGGALGSVARYGVSLLTAGWHHSFPVATFAVNVSGSLIIGAAAGWLGSDPHPEFHHQARLLLAIGLCGGFTTFSSFSLETLTLLRGGQVTTALSYIALSVLLCLGATALGYALTHR